jgi:hypothetical protein
MRRSSTLNNYTASAIIQEVGSKYDTIKEAAAVLKKYEKWLELDVDTLIAGLEEAKDFTGITVVAGSEASWDPVSKVLTVPILQGIDGQDGADGVNGLPGPQGAAGRTPTIAINYNSVTGDLEYDVTYNATINNMEW